MAQEEIDLDSFEDIDIDRFSVRAAELGETVSLSLEDVSLEEETADYSSLPPVNWSAAGVEDLVPQSVDAPKPMPERRRGTDPFNESLWLDHDPLPEVDVVVITWTRNEWRALHHVFNGDSGNGWDTSWYPYRRDLQTLFSDLWVNRLVSARNDARMLGSPSIERSVERWGSWHLSKVGSTSILIIRSELHLNSDGPTLPLLRFVQQLLEDCQPKLIISTGTSGGVDKSHVLGDVVISPAARFRLTDEFASASFNRKIYSSGYHPNEALIDKADELLLKVPEVSVLPPTTQFESDTAIEEGEVRKPKLILEDRPILTTDYFEFGTTDPLNDLSRYGCCVEMGDAAVGMAIEESGQDVPYLFIRSISDPVLNHELPRDLQVAWAVATYRLRGLWTSFNGALATWACIAGMEQDG